MSVSSIEFVLLLLLVSVVFFWIPTVRGRQLLLTLANFGFLYTQIPNPDGWIALGIFVVSGYLVVRLLQHYPSYWLLTVYLTALVAAFLVIKRYEFLKLVLPPTVFASTVTIVGLSYMLFRQIHVAVDSMQGQIDRLSFWTFVNYQTNLFGLLAGPIQRYQDFAQDWETLEPVLTESNDIVGTYRRLFLGVIKVSILSAGCLACVSAFSQSILKDSHQSAWTIWVKFAAIFYLYPAYIYFNFSGYCDIVIAGAALCSLRMPENFDFPFLSRNMIEFWTRWHRTLGSWIRDYVFTPLYMALAVRWPKRAASMAFLCFFVALFLAGIWHGSTYNFLIYGLLNAIGVSGAKLWENWLLKRSGRPGLRAYMQSRPIHVLAVIANSNFVCLTMFFFPADLDRSLEMLKALGRTFGYQG